MTATGSKTAASIPRIPKYERTLSGGKAQRSAAIVMAGNSIATGEIPVTSIEGSIQIDEKPPSRYRLDMERITSGAEEAAQVHLSNSQKSEPPSPKKVIKQRPPEGKRVSDSVRVSDYSPRALRDLGLPYPPKKSKTRSSLVPSKQPGSILDPRKSAHVDDGDGVVKKEQKEGKASRIPRTNVKVKVDS